jgi:hypothetical protein
MRYETVGPGNLRHVLAGALVVLGCSTSPREAPFVHRIDPDVPPVLRECLERPAVRTHLEAVHRVVMDAWDLPDGVSADQVVRVRMWMGGDGELLRAEPISSSSNALEESALDAVHEAAPFPPIPEDALCLGQSPWIASFRNPAISGAGASGDRGNEDSYIEIAAHLDAFGDTYLMHWPERKMPLAVYLPPPPEGLFEEPDVVFEAVRRAVLEWTDVASPGVPSFRFVESHGDADIPIVWAAEPSGDWYIAFSSLHVRPRSNLFDVEQVLVTGRRDGRVASAQEIHRVVLHEMGHALGINGHSGDSRDIMYPSIQPGEPSLSDRDRNTLRELYSRGNRQIRGRRAR